MDVVSTEDDGRDITWYTEMVRTLLTTCALNESLLARKYLVIISWTWSFLVGQKHRTARARIAEEDVYMKIATSPYQLNYLRQEVKDVRCINICRVKTCHLLRSFSDNFYEESLDLSGHQRQTCAHKLQTTVDVWMPWENSMRKGIHHGNLNKFNRYFNYARKRSSIHKFREPDIDDDDDDDDDKWMARFRDTLRTSLSFEPVCIPIASPPPQTKLLQQVKELVETGLEHQRLFCAKIPDSCYIQPHP